MACILVVGASVYSYQSSRRGAAAPRRRTAAMARRIRYVTAVAPREARGLVAEVYAAMRADFGRIAEPLAVHSPAPVLLAGAWGVTRETLLVGRVPRGV